MTKKSVAAPTIPNGKTHKNSVPIILSKALSGDL